MTKRDATKALCYIVRDGHLLVLRHVGRPDTQVGLQVPGGSVERGETPKDAAVREAMEETGLSALRGVCCLGEVTYDFAPYRSWANEQTGLP